MQECGISRIQCCLWFHVELLMLGLHCLPILCEFIMIFASLSISWIQFRPIMIWGRSYAICCRLSPLSILHQWDFQRGGRTRNCGKSGKLKQKIKNIPKSLQISNNLRKFAALVPAKPLNDAQMCGSFYFYTFPLLRFSYFQTVLISLWILKIWEKMVIY